MFSASQLRIKIIRSVPMNFLKVVLFSTLQLSDLQKENVRLREDLERENVARQTLQLQVESKDQLLSTMRAQADTRSATLQSSSYMIPTTAADFTSKTPAQDPSGKVSH